jgi:hypothetical protein
MATKDKILLPKGFRIIETNIVRYEEGNQILNYCNFCAKETDCKTSKGLRSAMGNNYLWWSNDFITTGLPKRYTCSPIGYDQSTFCSQYKSPQLKLPGILSDFCDGVERLVEEAREKKIRHVAEFGDVLERDI